MNNYTFYNQFSIEEKCLAYFKVYYEKKVNACPSCKSEKLKWSNKIAGWRCHFCTKKITLKSVSFMRDSNKSFAEWLEILHFVLNDKKPCSVKSILRQSKQTRYGTVRYMIRKIQLELGRVNQSLSFTKVSNLIFDGRFIDSINFPEKLVLFISTSENKKRDKIRFVIPETLRDLNRRLFKELELTNFIYPKLLKLFLPFSLKKTTPVKIKHSWSIKLTENAMKLLSGIHHEVAWYNLQFILDEYSFKYNYRNSKIWKVDVFLNQI